MVFAASVIVHEWGHLRWGLKDEYPTLHKGASKGGSDTGVAGAGGTIVQSDGDMVTFYQEHGEWKPVGYMPFSRIFIKVISHT